jgi:hypothetical protein
MADKPSEKPKAKPKRAIVGSEIYTWKEEKSWLAAWRRFNLVTQGRTEREAFDRLIQAIAFQAIFDAEDGKLKSYGSCPPVSDALLRKWKRAHKLAHANQRLLN